MSVGKLTLPPNLWQIVSKAHSPPRANVWKSWPHSVEESEEHCAEKKQDTIRLDMSVVIRLSPIAFDTRRMLIGNFKRSTRRNQPEGPLGEPTSAAHRHTTTTSFQVWLSCCRHIPHTESNQSRRRRRGGRPQRWRPTFCAHGGYRTDNRSTEWWEPQIMRGLLIIIWQWSHSHEWTKNCVSECLRQ